MTVGLILRLPNKIFRINREYSTNRKWKVLFFGSDAFSLASLKNIHKQFQNNNLIDKLEVVTNNRSNVIGKFSQSQKLPIHSWPLENLQDNLFDLGIVVSFGHLIPKSLIEYFPLGMINVHASLLPRWRGGAPIIHSLLNDDKITGVTIMQLKAHHFDIGNIINQKQYEVREDILQPELHDDLSKLGADTLVESLYNLPNCLKTSIKQDDSQATFAPKISPDLAKVNWKQKNARQVYNLHRALHGIYPLLTQFRGHIIKLHSISEDKSPDQKYEPAGKFIYDKESQALRIWCCEGRSVLSNSVSIPGKKPMKAVDFRNGYLKNVHPAEELYFEDMDLVDIKIAKRKR